MDIKLADRGREGELLLQGSMDAPSEEETGRILDQMVRRYDRLILNMAGVDYVFSPGLRLLKKTHLSMQEKGGELVVTYVDKAVMEVFELAGLTGLLHFDNS